MKFGIMQLASGGGGRTEGEVLRNSLELVELAEELGFHSAWIAEHHFTDYGLVANTLQFLSAAAMRTERIRLGAAVVVTTLHNPIRVAEEVAFLDVLSGGRVDIGVGRGYQPKEFSAFGLDPEDSRELFSEGIEFIKKAWQSTEPFDWNGKHYHGEGISILPRTLQQPHPPLWLACVSPATFDMAGEQGWQIMTSPNFTPLKLVADNFARYRKALTENGHDPSAFHFPVMQQVYVGETEESAYVEPQDPCMGYFQKLSSLLPSEVKGEGGASYEQFRKTQRKLTDMRYDYLYENGVSFGTAERVIEKIRHLQETANVDYLIGWFNFGTLRQDLAKASMRRFAEEVMPAFAEDAQAAEVA